MSASAPVIASATAPVTYVTYSAAAPAYTSAPVQYVDEQGNPVEVYQQPAVYNISPEIFARIANGGSMTQAEIDALLGGQTLEAAPGVTTATTSAKKKSMKVSKKKNKGCC